MIDNNEQKESMRDTSELVKSYIMASEMDDHLKMVLGTIIDEQIGITDLMFDQISQLLCPQCIKKDCSCD